MEIITQMAAETKSLGQKIGINIIRHPPLALRLQRGDGGGKLQATILALYGELGSGKTTFTQGLARGFRLPHRIVSPTFIIMREYPVKLEKFKRFYHIDLYRIENPVETQGLGLTEIFTDPANIVAIEWAERLGELLPKKRIDITFSQQSRQKRRITISELLK